ncbi:site-specific integrase [Humitalea rosea]|uniref:site-specific integrase n=1 Tax=Humitalea rosea TaxID=990373 RepID=UPI001314A570|nr:site-specific integrase [Humitalea rosea]
MAAITTTGPRFSTTRQATRLAARSLHKFRGGYGRWLGFLQSSGRLDADAPAAARATPENLEAFLWELLALGNADFTIAGRFDELRNALVLLDPSSDHREVTRPNGQSLRAWLPMVKRELVIHHPANLYLWGLQLMHRSRTLQGDTRRQVMLRDGLLICILAFRGLRLRSVLALTLGDNIDRDSETGLWHLNIAASDTKNGKYISAMLPEILAPWIDRYVQVERRELLDGSDSTAFWINWSGRKLEEKGLRKRIRWHSAKRFGEDGAFGTHRFRHCIATAAPLIHPDHPGLAASLLRITGTVMNAHYDRSGTVIAFASFHAALAAERLALAPAARHAFAEQDGQMSLPGLGPT